jgi:hypothetical protein
VKQDGGAGDIALGGLDLEAGLAVAGPAPGLVFAGLAGDDLDLVGDHEGAVEADAELADEVGVLLGVAGELGERKFLVPERAMVPRCETRSSSFMPMPVSAMVRVLFSSSSSRSMRGSKGSAL